ncbi:MAG TPA: hypothetical protein VMW19_15245 [Myxococcota bacterium]|nr:hypothetical protein [Myxococcota bacterium]
MLVLTGLVTALNLVLSLVVGLRLLGLARRGGWRAPELSLSIYFLVSAFLATPPQVVVYGGMGDPRLAVPDPVARALLAFAVLGMAIGAAAAYVFTWRTFRPERGFAKAIVVAGCACLAVGYAIEAIREGFAPVMFAGLGHWLGWLGRTLAMAGITFESFRYWRMLRRRLRLGLADPVVTNRFLLWAVWACCSTLNFVSDLASRTFYWLWFGTIAPVPAYLAIFVAPTIAVTMVLGAVSAVTLFLTFFPTPGYLRWVEARAAAAPAS